MKRVIAGLVLAFSCLSHYSSAQEEKKQLYERVSDSLFAFHFDSQYFLTDKNCEFFAVRRLSNYDLSLRTFNGHFTDYDLDGNIVLTGTYKQGKKDGIFKAYYPSGFLRWQAEYSKGNPVNRWFYYYPDGSPKAIFKIDGENARVENTWNEKGKAVIKDGSGKFELVDPQFGFNDKGYESLIYSGRVENGLAEGRWTVYYGYQGGQRELKSIYEFDKGILRTPADFKIPITPTEAYLNAENFYSKNCTIDGYYNYTLYLSTFLTERCSARADGDSVDTTIEFTLQVDNSGNSSKVTMPRATKYGTFNEVIIEAVRSVPYWIPSQKEGKTIKDTLTVQIDIRVDSEDKIYFTNPKIKRENGH